MNPTGALMLVLGAFVLGRLFFRDSNGQTLAARLAGGNPGDAKSTSSSAAIAPLSPVGAVTSVTNSKATGLAAETHSAAFAMDVLKSLGAPTTSANVSSLLAWINREGNLPGVDKFNPLDTTLPEPGAVSTNSVGVKSYTSWSQGVTATAQTLAGGYSAIVSALKAGVGINPATNSAVAQEIRKWSGSGYGNF
jgi:hypothetical protein